MKKSIPYPSRSIFFLPVENLEGSPYARFSQVPILLRTVFAQRGEQLRNVDIVVVVEVAKPPAKHIKERRVREQIVKVQTSLCVWARPGGGQRAHYPAIISKGWSNEAYFCRMTGNAVLGAIMFSTHVDAWAVMITKYFSCRAISCGRKSDAAFLHCAPAVAITWQARFQIIPTGNSFTRTSLGCHGRCIIIWLLRSIFPFNTKRPPKWCLLLNKTKDGISRTKCVCMNSKKYVASKNKK